MCGGKLPPKPTTNPAGPPIKWFSQSPCLATCGSLSIKKEESGAIKQILSKFDNKMTWINIYPNPASDEVQIDLSMYQGKKVDLYFFNDLGQMMMQKQVEKIGKEPITIDITALVNGQYQVHIAVEGKRSQSKNLIVSE